MVVVEIQIANMYFGRPEKWNPMGAEYALVSERRDCLLFVPLTSPETYRAETITCYSDD